MESQASPIIKLDAGGKIFPTKKSTIDKAPVLRMMVERDLKDESTAVFIDCDPTIFRHFLNYLRDSNYAIPRKYVENTYSMLNFFGLSVESEPTPVPRMIAKDYSLNCAYGGDQTFNITKFFGNKSQLIDIYLTRMDPEKITNFKIIVGNEKTCMRYNFYLFFKDIGGNIYKSTKYFKKIINNNFASGHTEILLNISLIAQPKHTYDVNMKILYEVETI